MQTIPGFLLPTGFFCATANGKIKNQNRHDMGILFSPKPCLGFGMFTSSLFRGHCVDICRLKLAKQDFFHGVLVNSGNSNTATGPLGRQDSELLLKTMATHLKNDTSIQINKRAIYRDYGDSNAEAVINNALLISHTGVIGQRLPMDTMLPELKNLSDRLAAKILNNDSCQQDFAQAIMTTDTVAKGGYVDITTSSGSYRISGVAKGAGMIAPNMATMLCYICTDANISRPLLQQCLQISVAKTFNCITVDGDMSPDDSIIILANGASKVNIASSEHIEPFQAGLDALCHYLAQQLIRDAEGATKFIEINISGAMNNQQARQAGLAIANSMLVKTAFFGCDANWGRVLSALGYCGVDFNLNDINLSFGPYQLCNHGQGYAFNENDLGQYLANRDIQVNLTIGFGPGQSRIWTSDLSLDYVKINADYRS